MPLSVITDLRGILLFINFSNVSGFVVHEHLSRYLKHKCNSCQSGFLKSKSSVIDMLSCVDYVSIVVSSRLQVDAIYFDHSSVFHLVPHPILKETELSVFPTVSPTGFAAAEPDVNLS